jgi:glutamate synthase (NADPH/NADH) small chain
MGKLKGFVEYDRTDEKYLSVTERLKNYKEFTITPDQSEMVEQGGRCMAVSYTHLTLPTIA